MGLRRSWSSPLVLVLMVSCGSLAGADEAKDRQAFTGRHHERQAGMGRRPRHEWEAFEDYYYYYNGKAALMKGAQGDVFVGGDGGFARPMGRDAEEAEAEWLRAAKKRRRDHKRHDKGLHMPYHSLLAPFDVEATLENWVTTGATIIEKQRVLMHPGVAERLGFMYCKHPLPTNKFEVVVQFKMKGKEQANRDAGFGFWYVMENMSAINTEAIIVAPTISEGMEQAGLNLLGSKGRFDGFGIVFTPHSDWQHGQISYVGNDGYRQARLADSTLSGTAEFPASAEFGFVKISSSVKEITVDFTTNPSEGWDTLFRAYTPIKPGGYIGMTAWSGKDSKGAGSLHVYNVDMKNVDRRAIREQMSELKEFKEFDDWNKEPVLATAADQEQHLRRLISMLTTYNIDAHMSSDGFIKQLEQQQLRTRKLDEQISELTRAFSVLVNHGEDNPVKQMADHIVGLRKLLVKDGAKHSEALAKVHQNVREVQDAKNQASNPAALTMLSEQTTAMENTVVKRSMQMSWLLVTFIGSVVIIGFLIFNRMQYYEKKHFL